MGNYWKSLDKLKIVINAHATTMYNGKEYRKAYIVESGNTSQLDAAMRWAKWQDLAPTVIETDNSGFSLQLAKAADGSSQGGRLSFWMCIISKDGMEPVAVGLNSDLLIDVLLQSTFVNGKCNEKVVFARKGGQLGVLHEKMTQYKDLKDDIAKRKNINRGKTKKWQVGKVYSTITQSDVYLGAFKPHLKVSMDCRWYDDTQRRVTCSYYDNAKKDMHVYTSTKYNVTFDDIVRSAFIAYDAYKETVPSRQCTDQLFENTDDIHDKYVASLIKYINTDEYFMHYTYAYIPEAAFAFIEVNKDFTIKILKATRARIAKYVKEAAHIDKTTEYHIRQIYEQATDTIKLSMFKNGKLIVDNTSTSLLEYYDRLIDLVKSVKI